MNKRNDKCDKHSSGVSKPAADGFLPFAAGGFSFYLLRTVLLLLVYGSSYSRQPVGDLARGSIMIALP